MDEVIKMRTEFPGQAGSTSDVPSHIAENIRRLGTLPPFVILMREIHPGFFRLLKDQELKAWIAGEVSSYPKGDFE